MGMIIKDPADFAAIRALLGGVGVEKFFPDEVLDTFAFVGAVEVVIRKLVKQQEPNGVKSVEAILATDDPNDTDYMALKSAAISYAVYIGSITLLNYAGGSVSDGEETVSYGGGGRGWPTIKQNFQLNNTAYYLSLLNNWVTADKIDFIASGPTKALREPDTLSGFRRQRVRAPYWIN